MLARKWIKAHGWLITELNISANSIVHIESEWSGKRSQMDQVAMAVKGTATENKYIKWEQGTFSYELPNVVIGNWEIEVHEDSTWVCLDRQYNRGMMPIISKVVLDQGNTLSEPGLYLLISGTISTLESNEFELIEGDAITADTNCLIWKFSMRRTIDA